MTGLGSGLLLSALVFTVFEAGGYRINLSCSLPLGLWQQITGITGKKEQFVAFCPPDWAVRELEQANVLVKQGFSVCRNSAAPFLKRIVAVPGDTVVVQENGQLLVNGRPRGGPLKSQTLLAMLKTGKTLIAPGHVFVMGEHSQSMDSRVLGVIRQDSLLSRYRPVLVFDSGQVVQ